MTYTYSHHGTEKNSQYLDASPLHPREGKIDQSKSNQKNKLPAVVLVDIWPNNEVKSKCGSVLIYHTCAVDSHPLGSHVMLQKQPKQQNLVAS